MKRLTTTLLLFIVLVFIATQCSTLLTEPETAINSQETLDEETMAFDQAKGYADEIDALEENAVLDSTDENVRRRCALALLRLDLLLGRVEFIVMRHDNEEAKDLYNDARDAQQNAEEAALIDSFETAFEYIKESRFLGLEAAKLVRDEVREQRDQIIERLRNEINIIEGLLEEIRIQLDENWDPAAARFARRSRGHLLRGLLALNHGELWRAGFHLRESKHLAQIALRVLSWNS